MTDEANVTKSELKTIMNLAIGKKSVVVAYVLWFFLGFFGAHRFYLGKPTSAIIMLVMSLVGYLTLIILIGILILMIVGVWWMIDAVLILVAAQKANQTIHEIIGGV